MKRRKRGFAKECADIEQSLSNEEQQYLDSVPDLAEDPEAIARITQRGKSLQLSQLFKHAPQLADQGFTPSRDMSLCRADWWMDYRNGQFKDSEGSPMTATSALTALWKDPNAYCDDLGKWMGIKGFRKWFGRSPVSELSRETAVLMEAAVKSLYDVLTSPDPKIAGAKVQAARTVAEWAGVGQKKKHEIHILDKQVSAMTTEEKQQLIARAAAMDADVDETDE